MGRVRTLSRSKDQDRIQLQAVLQVRSDLEDLLLQTVDTQSSFVKIQSHSFMPDAVHHVQVGLRTATANRNGDAEDVGITTAALCLWRRDERAEILSQKKQNQPVPLKQQHGKNKRANQALLIQTDTKSLFIGAKSIATSIKVVFVTICLTFLI